MNKKVVLFTLAILFLSVASVSTLQEIPKEVKDLAKVDFKEKTNSALNKSVEIPENLKLPAKILFGLEEDMPFSRFVVYLMFWLFVFLIIFQVVKIMPFFKEGVIKFIAALAISVLAGNLGGIEAVVNLYYDLSISKLIDATSPGAFFFAVVVILVGYYLIRKAISKLSTSLELGEIESSAVQAGTGYRILRIISSTFGGGSSLSSSSSKSSRIKTSRSTSSAKKSEKSSDIDKPQNSISENTKNTTDSNDIYDVSDAD